MWTVSIIDENSVEVIPTSWLIPNKNLRFWPPNDDRIATKIGDCVEPDAKTWKLFKIRFPGGNMKSYDTLIKARQSCQMAEEYSSLSELNDETTHRNRKRKNKRILSTSSSNKSSDDEQIGISMPKYPATNKLVSKRSTEDANSYLLNEHNENNTPRCAGVQNNSACSARFSVRRPTSPYCEGNITPVSTPVTPVATQSAITINNDLLRSIFREISKINVKIDILQKDVSTIISLRLSAY